MKNVHVPRLALFLSILAIGFDDRARASCGAENCPLDNSAYGGRARRVSFELSYLEVDQDRSRTWTHDVSDPGILVAGGELRTFSRVTMGKAIYSLGRRALLSASLPYIERIHRHVSAEGLPEPEYREWAYSGLGDLTLLGSWTALGRGGETSPALSLQAGVKLPTGRRHVPAIEGEEPEPHALPGSGSTDLLGGFQVLSGAWIPTPFPSASPTILFASALYTHRRTGTGGYRIGSGFEAHLGAGYPLGDRLRFLAQINTQIHGKDHSESAEESETGGHTGHATVGLDQAQHDEAGGSGVEHENTGGVSVFAAPGLRFQIRSWIAISSYVQIPLYQSVNGTQLVAPAQMWLGATYKLP